MLLWLVPYLWPGKHWYYLGVLVFLALGLRPLLERSGLYRCWLLLRQTLAEAWPRKSEAGWQQEIARREREQKYRFSRTRASPSADKR